MSSKGIENPTCLCWISSHYRHLWLAPAETEEHRQTSVPQIGSGMNALGRGFEPLMPRGN